MDLPIIQPRNCGGCTMCCKTMGVAELNKPPNTWCSHCDTGTGCKIYEDRPHTCREFQCLWLQSNILPDVRPDRCNVVLGPTMDGGSIVAYENIPGAADKGHMCRILKLLVDGGLAVIVICGGSRKMRLR